MEMRNWRTELRPSSLPTGMIGPQISPARGKARSVWSARSLLPLRLAFTPGIAVERFAQRGRAKAILFFGLRGVEHVVLAARVQAQAPRIA